MIAPGIAVVNASTLVTADQAQLMVIACHVQAIEFCDAWSKARVSVTYFADPKTIPRGTPTFPLVDSDDVPDALAWHSEDARGRIVAAINVGAILAAGGGILDGYPSVSGGLSHEIPEALADPFVNEWIDFPDGLRSIAKEVCDPVQNTGYVIGGVAVSNFVLPSYFDGSLPRGERVDRNGVLDAPFSRTEGGYFVWRNADGNTVQSGERPPWKMANSRGAVRALSRLAR